MKPDFDKAEILARKIRLQQTHNNLSLNVLEMEFDLPIIFETFKNYSRITNTPISTLTAKGRLKEGYTICRNGIYIVLYDSGFLFEERLNWTLAHEVGHIYLNHNKDGNKEEVEAHWFAAELLAPELIIRKISNYRNNVGKELDAFDIREIFHISYEAAIKRVNSLNRKHFYNTYLEKETFKKYKDFIYKHGFVYQNNYKVS